MAPKYGPLVRLWGVHPSQFPPSGAPASALEPFLSSILNEALPFIDTVPQNTVPSSASRTGSSGPWKPKDIKTYPHSISPIHLYGRSVSADELQAVVKEHEGHVQHLAQLEKPAGEAWVLRRSVHEDKAAEGTAAWDEWVRCFKDEHAEAEEQFTPTVIGTRRAQTWDCAGVAIPSADGSVWTDWTLRLESSTHKMPAPLKDRVFPVLQATAAAQGRRDFLVVQIAAHDESLARDAGIVKGSYTSIERVRETDEGIEWTMGTASDARGMLPGWVQKKAVPSQIAKDVDMFLGWIAKARNVA